MRYIGNKNLYRRITALALPMAVQNAISNFVNMLDNVMVGRVGTEQMSGVSIVNQLMFVFMLCIFGSMSGVGIFTAQYYGKNDQEGIRNTFKIKLYVAILVSVIFGLIFYFAGDNLIMLWLQSEEETLNTELVISSAKSYFAVMLVGILPFAISNVYAGTLRETSQTVVPMVSGIAAVSLNLVFNYFLIYGKCGFPELGVEGAAIATVMSRFLEMGILIVWTHRHTEKNPFITGVYKNLKVPGNVVKEVAKRAWPLALNETLWSSGVTTLNQCYSLRGISVVAAMNINSTLFNVMNVAVISIGNAVGIILGQTLGAKKFDEARDAAPKMLAFSVFVGVISGLISIAISGVFPQIYNTDDNVRHLAQQFITVFGCWYLLDSYINCSYFIIRSGGKTFITFLFDSCFVWAVSVPLAFILGHFTDLSCLIMLIIVQAADFIKCIVGHILIKKGIWVNNIIE